MLNNNELNEAIKSLVSQKNDALFAKFTELLFDNTSLFKEYRFKASEVEFITSELFESLKRKANKQMYINFHASDDDILHLFIINDDTPFIVDSITEYLNKKKFSIVSIINEVIYSSRNSDGKLEALSKGLRGDKSKAESVISIKLKILSSAKQAQKIVSEIEDILTNVRLAVYSWGKIVAELANAKKSIENSEEVFFLDWLENHNFTFTSFVECEVDKEFIRKSRVLGCAELEKQDFFDELIDDVYFSNIDNLTSQRVLVGKFRRASKVHRYSSLDYVCLIEKRQDSLKLKIFLGLFSTKMEYQSATNIPIIRHKVENVIKRAGFSENGFNNKELISIIESLPRDDLFQLLEDELFDISFSILGCLHNPKLMIFARKNKCKEFVNFLIFFPKNRITADISEKISNYIGKKIHGKMFNLKLKVSNVNLAYLQLTIKVKNNLSLEIDAKQMEKDLEDITSLWVEKYENYVSSNGDSEDLCDIDVRRVFHQDYKESNSYGEAVTDVKFICKISDDLPIILDISNRNILGVGRSTVLSIYKLSPKIKLHEIIPVLDSFGLNVAEEKLYKIQISNGKKDACLHQFILDEQISDSALDACKSNLLKALEKAINRTFKSDILNKLIKETNLGWHDLFLLYAYCKYMQQIKFPYSQDFIKYTLVKHSKFAKSFVKLFYAKFEKLTNSEEIDQLTKNVADLIAKVETAAEDKVLTKFFDLLKCTVRTNFFLTEANGDYKNYISFKFASSKIPELPLPKPLYEIFVYSADMEGIHLRSGKISRGGIRWSDHGEDFRTEILGLMKAQRTKNTIIVPDGSKGGFIVKNSHLYKTREEFQQAGINSYKTLLMGMLDITDNIAEGKIVKPLNVITYDEDDPYLVVAADKGTATFSDIANKISAEYKFWLSDAFASGGSAGYDHKAIGITARGAWVSCLAHFEVLGIDPYSQDFTAVGIGDMSGDVFGNGLLLSDHYKLIAAFNHMHIFIDPNPDSQKSFHERKRLFEMPRSTWADYNPDLISKGGGVYDRSSKSIKLSNEAKEALSIDVANEELAPDLLIKHILKAKVDLLWNGGIGTYCKAKTESHESIGNKVNDNLRVNGSEIRARIVSEGGNLGFTQLGRIEYALNGGLINTDFIDNSGGVDCSDHEVNIKIALAPALESEKLSLEKRNKLLAQMQNEVSDLLLLDNHNQNLAISIALHQGFATFDQDARLINILEESAGLDPELEFLPSQTEINRRRQENIGFTRPEIAILMSYSKNAVYKSLSNTLIPDEKYLEKLLVNYFPKLLQKQYLEEILNHKLKREIILTIVSNQIVNHLGNSFFHEAQNYTGLKGCDIARAYYIVWDLFGLEELWQNVCNIKIAKTKMDYLVNIRNFAQDSIFWFLNNFTSPLQIPELIDKYTVGLKNLHTKLLKSLLKDKLISQEKAHLVEIGVVEKIAEKLSILSKSYAYLDVVTISSKCGINEVDSAFVYFSLMDKLSFNWLIKQASELETEDYWQQMLNRNLIDDLYQMLIRITNKIIKSKVANETIEGLIDKWMKKNESRVNKYQVFISSLCQYEKLDVAKIMVAIKYAKVLAGV